MTRARPELRRLVGGGVTGMSDAELLAVALGGPASLAAARTVLDGQGLDRLPGMLPAELASAAGIRVSSAASALAAIELGRRASLRWPAPGWRVRTPADVAERLLPELGHLEREELIVCLLNTRNVVLGRSTVYVGNLAGSPVRIGEVFRDAIRRQAAAVIVAHNHPSGDPSPSGDDLRITADLADAGRLLDIELLDHLVIGHDRWISLRAAGAM